MYRHGPATRTIPRAVRRRAVRQAEIPRLPGVTCSRFGGPEVLSPGRPKTIGGRSSLSPLALRRHALQAPFVAEVRDAWLVGRHAVPFTCDGHMLLTGFRDALPLLALERHPELEAWVSRSSAVREPPVELTQALGARAVCSLVGRFDLNYFHWMIDFCGQLEALRAYASDIGEQPAILIRAGAPAFARESLTLLGFEPGLTLEWPLPWWSGLKPSAEDLIVARVPRLLVSAWRGYRHGSSRRSLAWLRTAFLAAARELATVAPSDAGQSGGFKIYVRRSPSGWRAIANEEEVHRFLEQDGFLSLHPEEHSLADQIALFSRARLIVGMHGAGLTNILFAPGAQLIELVGGYGGPEYFSMAHGLGNPYIRVQCASAGENIRVDLRLLASALKSLPHDC